jgi:hypothetical protein
MKNDPGLGPLKVTSSAQLGPGLQQDRSLSPQIPVCAYPDIQLAMAVQPSNGKDTLMHRLIPLQHVPELPGCYLKDKTHPHHVYLIAQVNCATTA